MTYCFIHKLFDTKKAKQMKKSAFNRRQQARKSAFEPLEERQLLAVTGAALVSPIADAGAVDSAFVGAALSDAVGETIVVDTISAAIDDSDGRTSLPEAIIAANDGDTIAFDPNLSETTITLSSELTIDKSITIDGDNRIVLDGDKTSRIFNVDGTTGSHSLALLNISLTQGQAEKGGAVCVGSGCALTLENVKAYGNAAVGDGGVICNDGGEVTITSGEFTGNSGGYGGVICNNAGSVNVTNADFSGNMARSQGGVIYNAAFCELTATNSVFTGNSSSNTGGAIFNNGNLTLTNDVFSGNSATTGGGVTHRGSMGAFSATNCVFSGNTANNNGGAIYSTASFSLCNTTIAGNKALLGGGVWAQFTKVKAYNSIVAQNYSMNGPAYANVYGSLTEDFNNFVETAETECAPGFVAAPEFGEDGTLRNGNALDLHLSADSPAIDAGNSNYLGGITTDVDGNTRVVGGNVDIGAYEYQENTPVVPVDYSVVTTLEDSVAANDGKCSLREAILYSPADATITFAEDLNGSIVLSSPLATFQNVTVDGDNRIVLDGNSLTQLLTVGASVGASGYEAVFSNISFANGKSETGGCVSVSNGCTLTLTNAKLYDNESTYLGGALHVWKGDAVLTNVEFSNNSAYNDGGALYVREGAVTASNVKFFCNSANNGGAIYSTDSVVSVANSVFVGNSASFGGAVYNGGYSYLSYVDLLNCTVAGNTSPVAALFNGGNDFWMRNTIAALNYGSDYSGGSSMLHTSSNNHIGSDPGFVVAPSFDANGALLNADQIDLRLQDGSTIIDAGDSSFVAEGATDFEGNPRVVGDSVDIGAYENQTISIAAPLIETIDFTATRATVSWNAVDGAQSYLVKYRLAGETDFVDFGECSETTCLISGLTATTAYEVCVVATDGEGGSAESALASFTTGAAKKLTKVKFKSTVTDSKIELSWKAIPNAVKYYVQYKADDASTYKSFYTTDPSCAFEDLLSSTSYDIRVKAIPSDPDFKNADYTNITLTTEYGAPRAPQVEATELKATTALLSWNAVEYAQGYQVLWREVGSTTYNVMNDVTTTSFRISGLDAETSYEYSVVAKGDGIHTNDLASETVVFATTAVKKLTKPVLKKSTTDSSATIIWKPVANAVKYLVQYKAASDSSYTSLGYMTETSFTLDNLDPDAEYAVRVKAVPNNPDYKNSDYTNLSFTTLSALDQALAELAEETNDDGLFIDELAEFLV